MSNRTLRLNDALYEYILNVSLRETDVLRRLREETAALPERNMQIAPEQGQFMALLARLTGASRCIEIGVFTGYSTLVVAQALPGHGYIFACDISDEWTSIGRRYWHEAGVGDRIDLRLGPAIDSLDQLLESGQMCTFDMAFIDADKTGYRDYYERILKLLRPGGFIAIDNVLWGGSVIDSDKNDDDTRAIRELNAFLHTDDRVDLSLVPIGDGLTLARKA